MSEAQMMNSEVNSHYLTAMSPAEIAEHLKDIFPEFDDLNVDEVLLMQESAFLYIQNNKQSGDVTPSYGETSTRSLVLPHESESSSHGGSIESQLALDEALARALELGDDDSYFHDHEDNTVGNNTRSSFRETPTRVESQNTRQDDIDPDNMTYEELHSLGESVGSESRGLSADLISRLPSFKYKAGLFSKKKKEKQECVICYSEYKHGAKLTTLPCAHQYHSNCIAHWLQLKKQCPVCQEEVLDE